MARLLWASGKAEFPRHREVIHDAGLVPASSFSVGDREMCIRDSGGTARYLSRFRSSAPIYAFSRHDGARRKMAMIRDVFPIACLLYTSRCV